MKLRTRLFLWIGIIFFLAFGFSLYFETHLTDDKLQDAEKSLRDEILSINEEKRMHVERYLHVALSEDQALIDALLFRIARDPKLGATLFLDGKDLDLIAPSSSAFLFKNEKWIDFIQSTEKGALTSLLIPIDFPMRVAHSAPIDQNSSWVILNTDRKIEHPYIGVKLIGKPEENKNLSVLFDELVDIDWGLTVLFDPGALLEFEKKTPLSGELEGIDVGALEQAVFEVAEYLKKAKEKHDPKDWMQKEIATLSKKGLFAGKPYEEGIGCLKKEGEHLNAKIIQLLQRGDQAIMLSAISSLFPSGVFGSSPFSPMAPKGIARFLEDNRTGHGVLTDEVFFKQKAFEDAQYIKAHPSTKECENVGSALAVIAMKNHERVFVGNTLQLKGKTNSGLLTVAIDANRFVEDLAFSLNQSGFLVHDGEVVSAFCSDGTKIPNAKDEIPFNPKMLKEKSGTFCLKGTGYYFLHMVPFKHLDLHFYTFQPEKKAFALVRSIDESSRKVIHSISTNMRIMAFIALVLVLFLLHHVAKKITKPIVQLANATNDVAAGKLEGISLPEVPKGRHDEIAKLCASFAQMVQGLQEKEMVKGVLNKVVSPEIAKEITKGQIHLGGEEKKITVLFADIRDFTHMTENKKPQEVVEMLNTCMTKISHVVDEFGGVIDKYVGDEIMALFGAPFEKEESALKAVQSALKMQVVLEEWNRERKNAGLESVEMGVGIHTGIVLVGNMGAENRLNYTVIGSNVNLAARMCGSAKRNEILISKETLDEPHVKENIEVEELPPTELKGFEKTVILFRVKRGK